MQRPRVIPVLLLLNDGLVKTTKFKNPVYIGDPLNAIRIFNDKEVDELILLDIRPFKNKQPDFNKIKQIAGECFMPLCYGGGIRTVEEIKQILNSGVEKIALNSSSILNPGLIKETAKIFGNQSIVISIDVKKNWLGKYELVYDGATKKHNRSIEKHVQEMEELGAGEIIINAVDKDGTFEGYDEILIRMVCSFTNLPVIASGGARSINDFVNVVKNCGASAVAAGALFVFQGPLKGVLINYPNQQLLKEEFYSKI